MKFEIKKIFAVISIALLSAAGCTSSDINDEIPVSSNDLVDHNVVYKSETVSVDVEKEAAPKNNLKRTKEPEEVKQEVNEEMAEADNIEVVVPPPAGTDEVVDFTDATYVENSQDMEFEMAVMQAQERRGIRPTYSYPRPQPKKVEPKVAKPFDKKLEVKEVEREPERSITFLSTIVYHSNTKADISPRDIKALKNVAAFAKKHNATIRVVGNSSSRSKDMKEIQNKIANFDLSLLRAQNVRDVLVNHGVPANKIFISAVADTEKVVQENMPLNEAINRRTEIYINY